MTHTSHPMKQHNFNVMCPIALFMDTASGPHKHEK
jgi:hypothetical protein